MRFTLLIRCYWPCCVNQLSAMLSDSPTKILGITSLLPSVRTGSVTSRIPLNHFHPGSHMLSTGWASSPTSWIMDLVFFLHLQLFIVCASSKSTGSRYDKHDGSKYTPEETKENGTPDQTKVTVIFISSAHYARVFLRVHWLLSPIFWSPLLPTSSSSSPSPSSLVLV